MTQETTKDDIYGILPWVVNSLSRHFVCFWRDSP